MSARAARWSLLAVALLIAGAAVYAVTYEADDPRTETASDAPVLTTIPATTSTTAAPTTTTAPEVQLPAGEPFVVDATEPGADAKRAAVSVLEALTNHRGEVPVDRLTGLPAAPEVVDQAGPLLGGDAAAGEVVYPQLGGLTTTPLRSSPSSATTPLGQHAHDRGAGGRRAGRAPGRRHLGRDRAGVDRGSATRGGGDSFLAMGQPVTVLEKPSSTPGVVRFEINRSLTGMGHERYASRDEASGERPVDELARRLFDRGGIDRVHVNSNVITVDLAKGATTAGLVEVITDLFLHYREGVTPPAL